ncbi:MAG: NAD(P)H-binding protein [Paludibacter sp.]|nr:NAD(P)H-binding protein [Paludibacter sp.]
MKKAIVIGATGMVGTQLIHSLIENDDYSEIISLVRRTSGITDKKLTEHIINFDKPDTWEKLVTGDVLFSTLGTTIAQAKTKKEQYKVDFIYQYTVAEIAAKNSVSHYVLVSSAGANSSSMAFYTKMKGELEDAVKSLPFDYITLLRPGQLEGNRVNTRPAEKIALSIMHGVNKLGLFNRYRPILDVQVAQAMIAAASKSTSATYTLQEVFELIE